jgi:nucleoside-diphosphate kinase
MGEVHYPNKTLVIVKPDAVEKNAIGPIVARFEQEGFRVQALRMLHLSKRQAEGFYHVHMGRPFFAELTEFMSSGPCVPMVLSGPEDIIHRVRTIVGDTDSARAAQGTIRNAFGTDKGKNAVHASDSQESADFEIGYYFRGLEL